jgi:hypothetical protein
VIGNDHKQLKDPGFAPQSGNTFKKKLCQPHQYNMTKQYTSNKFIYRNCMSKRNKSWYLKTQQSAITDCCGRACKWTLIPSVTKSYEMKLETQSIFFLRFQFNFLHFFLPSEPTTKTFYGCNGTAHFKKVNNCLNTIIYSYLETCGG